MKKVILSLAACICFAVSASAQNEVPGAVNNNSAPSDENVHGPTKMDMQPGMQTTPRTQTREAAQADAQLNTPPVVPAPANGTQTNRPNDADVNRATRQRATMMNNSGTTPKARTNMKTNSSTR